MIWSPEQTKRNGQQWTQNDHKLIALGLPTLNCTVGAACNSTKADTRNTRLGGTADRRIAVTVVRRRSGSVSAHASRKPCTADAQRASMEISQRNSNIGIGVPPF